MRAKYLAVGLLAMLVGGCFSFGGAETAKSAAIVKHDLGAPFGQLELVDEIQCGEAAQGRQFFDYPNRVSKVATILGEKCRVLPNDSDTVKYFSYLIGKGKPLQANGAYLLVVDFPDNEPRNFHVTVGGCESTLGIASGEALSDSLKNYLVDCNAESINYPLSGKMQQLKIFFFLHDYYPEMPGNGRRFRTGSDGFFVTVNQYTQAQNPLSKGAAVKRLALYKIDDPKALYPQINYPDGSVPRRYLFWREEMADGVVFAGNPDDSERGYRPGMIDAVDWYRHKVGMARFLGMNTFCRDLLEFGHNQGWDSSKYGGDRWFIQPPPELAHRWGKIIDMLSVEAKDMYVMPYYEYAGSRGRECGVGNQMKCRRPDGKNKYTDVGWLRTNLDLSTPEALEDVTKLLDCTITQYKDKVNFIGAWFRPRMEQHPISFSETAVAKFNAANQTQYKAEDFQNDRELLRKYCDWYLTVRRDWLEAVRDYLRKEVSPGAVALYTADFRDPGANLQTAYHTDGPRVVTDQVGKWRTLLGSELYRTCKEKAKYANIDVMSLAQALNDEAHYKAITTYLTPTADDRPVKENSDSRWDLACPPTGDLQYQPGTGMTYPFSRLYTVSVSENLKHMHNQQPTDFAMIRHYMLNEHEMGPYNESVMGGFFSMCDRTAPYTMLAEARALAYGDPRYIGYLTPASMLRSNPQLVRDFNLAFLALPAVPSKLIDSGSDSESAISADNYNIMIRRYETPQGIYYALINIGLEPQREVKIQLEKADRVVNRVAMQDLPLLPNSKNPTVMLDFYPGQVYTVKLENNPVVVPATDGAGVSASSNL